METNEKEVDKSKNLKLAAIFGIIFGFLLQKGGVAKYHVLVNQLMLKDFTVIKIMLSAILVGMIGHYFLVKKNQAKVDIKPFQPIANILGGLLFGIGFACAGFCPGTGAAALGQGDFEALYYMSGMILGSYLYAEGSSVITSKIKKKIDFGKMTVPQLFHATKSKVVFGVSFLLLSVLILSRVN